MKAVGILTTCLVNPCQAQGEKKRLAVGRVCAFPVDQPCLFARFLRSVFNQSTLQELSPHPVSMARAALHPPSARRSDGRCAAGTGCWIVCNKHVQYCKPFVNDSEIEIAMQSLAHIKAQLPHQPRTVQVRYSMILIF